MTLEESYKLAYKLKEEKLEEAKPVQMQVGNSFELTAVEQKVLKSVIYWCDIILKQGQTGMLGKAVQGAGKAAGNFTNAFKGLGKGFKQGYEQQKNSTDYLLSGIDIANRLQEANLSQTFSIAIDSLKNACKQGLNGNLSLLGPAIKQFKQLPDKEKIDISNILTKKSGTQDYYPWDNNLQKSLNALLNRYNTFNSQTRQGSNSNSPKQKQNSNIKSSFQVGTETNSAGGNSSTSENIKVDPASNPGEFLKQNGITQQSIDILKASGRTEEEIAALSARLYTNISDSMGLKDSGNPSIQENNSKVLNNFINHLKTKGFLPSSYAFK